MASKEQMLASSLFRMMRQEGAGIASELAFGVGKVKRSAALRRLANELADGSMLSTTVDELLGVIQFDMDVLTQHLQRTYRQAAQRTMRYARAGEFNQLSPRALEVTQELGTRMNVDFSTQLRNELRQHLTGAVGLPREQAGRFIRDRVGLLPQHVQAVENYRTALENEGLPKSRVNRQVKEKHQRLLNYRMELVSRTETARAMSEGQLEAWEQAVENGSVSSDTMRRWVISRDERTCPICRSMSGKTAPIDGHWNTPNGPVRYPSATHPQCRCTTVLVRSR